MDNTLVRIIYALALTLLDRKVYLPPIDLHPSICRPWFSAACHGIQVTCVYVKQVLETSVFPRKESSFWLETHVRDARCVYEGLRGEALGSLGTRPHSERYVILGFLVCVSLADLFPVSELHSIPL